MIAVDRDVLARFLNSFYDNILTQEQADDLLMTYFDDWVNLPSPPLRNVLKKIDFPVSVKDQFNAKAGAVHHTCRRFEAFIYSELVNATHSLGDYMVWLGWFLIGEDDIQAINRIVKSSNMEQMLKKIREPSIVTEKKTVSIPEQGNRIRFDFKASEKPNARVTEEPEIVEPVKSFLLCMKEIFSDKELVIRLKEILPYL
ncbi:MAG: hypothetical protein GX640_23025 [Fibrobacter sp.]|nr:hypothetical protein [Fibrobacter sp.]